MPSSGRFQRLSGAPSGPEPKRIRIAGIRRSRPAASGEKSVVRKKVLLYSFPVFLAICALSYFTLDRPVAVYCRGLDKSVRDVFRTVTYLGVSTWYMAASAAVFAFFRFVRKREAWSNRGLLVFLSVALSGIITDLIKFVLGRARPTLLFEKDWYGFYFFETKYAFLSFPSGHAATVAALAVALYFMFPRYGFLYALGMLLVMASRVVIGSHYPGDVIFGAYLGAITALAVGRVMDSKGFGTGIGGRSERMIPVQGTDGAA